MEDTDLGPLIEQLDDNIDDLEEALAPLLKTALSDTAGRIPVLDKAQLYVLVTYAIESILFSYLRLNGVNAKEHPVFRELTRVKQYVEKVKAAELAGTKPNAKLDQAAASRFIKHALAGHEKYGLNRAEQQAKEKAAAHIKFEQNAKKLDIDGEGRVEPQAGTSNDDAEPKVPALEAPHKKLAEQNLSLNTTGGDKAMKSHKRKRKSHDIDMVPDMVTLSGKLKRN